ncbi:SBBP repeat-containing protein [Hymenobacter coalescens]
MNVRLFCLLWAVLGAALPGQGQTIAWRFADVQPFEVKSVATDGAGNAYVTGQFRGTITLGQTSLTSRSNTTDVLVAKFSPQGRAVWATSIGPEPSAVPVRYQSSATAHDISVNPLTGEAYVVAGFVGTITRNTGGGALTSFGVASPDVTNFPSVLVLKLLPRGQVDWARRAGNSIRPVIGSGIATDLRGNSYVTGETSGTVHFDDGYDLVLGSRQLMIFSLDYDGRTRWGASAPTPLSAAGLDIGVDAQHGCYVVGRFVGPLRWGSVQLDGLGANSTAFVGRLDQRTGAMSWARQGNGGAGVDNQAQSIAVDALGNSFVAGLASPGTNVIFGYLSPNTGNNVGAFVARLDAGGTPDWVRIVNNVQEAGNFKDIQVANLSPLPLLQQALVAYATPRTRAGSSLRLLTYEPDGDAQMLTSIDPVSSGSISAPQGLAVAPGGASLQAQVYLGGYFEGSVRAGAATLTTTGRAGFLAGTTYRFARRSIDWSTLRMYPNPASEQLTLRLPGRGRAQVVLYNHFGHAVRELSVADSSTDADLLLDVRSLPAGLYTLRVTSGGESESRQLQVQ